MRRFLVKAGAAPSPPPSPPSPPRSRRGLANAAEWSYPFSSMIFWICSYELASQGHHTGGEWQHAGAVRVRAGKGAVPLRLNDPAHPRGGKAGVAGSMCCLRHWKRRGNKMQLVRRVHCSCGITASPASDTQLGVRQQRRWSSQSQQPSAPARINPSLRSRSAACSCTTARPACSCRTAGPACSAAPCPAASQSCSSPCWTPSAAGAAGGQGGRGGGSSNLVTATANRQVGRHKGMASEEADTTHRQVGSEGQAGAHSIGWLALRTAAGHRTRPWNLAASPHQQPACPPLRHPAPSNSWRPSRPAPASPLWRGPPPGGGPCLTPDTPPSPHRWQSRAASAPAAAPTGSGGVGERLWFSGSWMNRHCGAGIPAAASANCQSAQGWLSRQTTQQAVSRKRSLPSRWAPSYRPAGGIQRQTRPASHAAPRTRLRLLPASLHQPPTSTGAPPSSSLSSSIVPWS